MRVIRYQRTFLLRDTQKPWERTGRVLVLTAGLWLAFVLAVWASPDCRLVYQTYQFVLEHFGADVAAAVIGPAVGVCDGV